VYWSAVLFREQLESEREPEPWRLRDGSWLMINSCVEKLIADLIALFCLQK